MSVVFDRAVAFYDQTRGLPPHVEPWIADVVREHAPLQPGSSVLEIGVGTGRIALPLAQRNGYRYTGVDLSREMMRRLQAKAHAALIALLQADITTLPFVDHTFDAVVAVHIFHLVDHWQRALDEVQRVLRDGGVLLHGRNHHVGMTGVRQFRQKLYSYSRAKAAWRGTGLLDQADIRPQLECRFGPPQEFATPSWSVSMTAREVLQQFRDRVYSSTWSIDEAALAAACDQGERWAIEQYGDLDVELTDEQIFTWELYTRRVAQ